LQYHPSTYNIDYFSARRHVLLSATAVRLLGCLVCGEANGVEFWSFGRLHCKCFRCGTIRKVISKSEYANISPTYDPGTYVDGYSSHELEKYMQVSNKRKVLLEAIELGPGNGKGKAFLDIGCGMGGYMLAAKQLGFEVLGFEPSANHARVATDILHLPVVLDYFTSDRLEGRRFDLIMLSHVIEHIYDQKHFLLDVMSALAPGGVLIVVTPNARSLIASITGGYWPMLRPVDHVNLLSRKAFEFLLPGVRYSVRTSEHGYEFAATILSAVRSAVRKERARPSSAVLGRGDTIMSDSCLVARTLRALLYVASMPFCLWSVLVDNAACLRVRVTNAPSSAQVKLSG